MVYQSKNVPTLQAFQSGEWSPAEFRVLCYVTPTKANHISKPLIVSVGNAHSIEQAARLIEKDKEAMRDTFGGLVAAAGNSGRDYVIFRSAGWSICQAEKP